MRMTTRQWIFTWIVVAHSFDISKDLSTFRASSWIQREWLFHDDVLCCTSHSMYTGLQVQYIKFDFAIIGVNFGCKEILLQIAINILNQFRTIKITLQAVTPDFWEQISLWYNSIPKSTQKNLTCVPSSTISCFILSSNGNTPSKNPMIFPNPSINSILAYCSTASLV